MKISSHAMDVGILQTRSARFLFLTCLYYFLIINEPSVNLLILFCLFQKLYQTSSVRRWSVVNFSARCDVQGLVKDLKRLAIGKGLVGFTLSTTSSTVLLFCC